jgi:DNA mismatch repair ATPase MutS
MSGKSTYIKACGIAVYLAHIGMGVPAAEMEFTPFDVIYTSIYPEDNIQQGYSYFYSEVMRVKTIALKLKAGLRALVIFDELFRGTNVKDAYDSSLLVISGFSNWDTSFFILSSHLTELEAQCSVLPGIVFRCFDSAIIDGKPHYGYRLLDGINHEHHGILILYNEGIPDLLSCDKSAGKDGQAKT